MYVDFSFLHQMINYKARGGGGGGVGWGGVFPIMDYTGRLRPKGVPFSGGRYIKGWRFHELKYRKRLGKLKFRY